MPRINELDITQHCPNLTWLDSQIGVLNFGESLRYASLIRSINSLAQSLQWEPHSVLSNKRDANSPNFDFPKADLLRKLLDSYFLHFHPGFLLLHRPTFETSVQQRLHLVDAGFGSVLLLVLSIGARWVDDSRVLLEDGVRHTAGWKWFNQVELSAQSLLAPPRLCDLQLYCVRTKY
jgi:hypothetical protein